MRDFKKFRVWRRAHQFVLSIYRDTSRFPAEERYGLRSQLRRASVSVPSNIAEGCGRSSDGDFARFVDYAGGSACEAEYQLILARDLGYLDETTYERLDKEVEWLKIRLRKLRQSLSS